MKLPQPSLAYDADNESQMRAQLEREDARNLKKQRIGTFTPTDGSGAGLTLVVIGTPWYSIVNGVLTGKFSITWPVTVNGANATIAGLPLPSVVAAGGDGAIVFYKNAGFDISALVNNSAATIALYDWAGVALTNANLSGKSLGILVTYNVGDR